MTFNDWKGLQNQGYFASGAYQFILSTSKLAAREFGIDGTTVMTLATGSTAIQLMTGSKRPRLLYISVVGLTTSMLLLMI